MYEDFGELHLPVTAEDVTDTLGPLDEGVHVLAELFRTAINAELAAAWTKITDLLPTTHPLRGTSPVADTLEVEPTTQIMTQRRQVWPLLCVHRSGTGQYEQHTLELDRLTQPWSLHYILGPLDVGDLHKLNRVCIAVSKIVRMVIRNRGHIAYQNGVAQFFPGTGAHFAAINLKSHDGPGQAALASEGDGLLYYAITLNLETIEVVQDRIEDLPYLEGATYEVGVGGSEGTLPGLIYATTDAWPTP